MIRYFKVIVIDDDPDVLERLRERVKTDGRPFEGVTYQVELRPVLVSVEPSDDGKYRICRSTLESLAAACNEEPGLILADYGYAQKQVIAELREKAQNGPELTEQDVAGRFLTTADLISAVREYSGDPAVDSYKRRMMDVNFLRFSKKLYLYSYTSKEFKRAMGEVVARATRTKAALQGCTVIPIDTKYEFYNGDEFDWPNSSKHDGRFYAHLAAGLINHIIQHELLESILEDAKRLKFVRIRSSAVAVAFIIALGGAIGACTVSVRASPLETRGRSW